MMTCNKFIFLSFIAITILCQQDLLQAQVTQPYRFEKERKMSDDDYSIITLDENGLALIREKNKYKSGNKTWELILLDSTLQEKQNLDLEIDQRKNLIGYEKTHGYLYLLFKTSEVSRPSFTLSTIKLETGQSDLRDIKPELAIQLTHFIKVGENFIVGGYVNNEPAVLLYNPVSDNIKVLPGFFQKQTELVDLRPNQNETFNAILIDRSDRDQRKIIFKTFDSNGVELLEDQAIIEGKIALQTGISSTLILEDLLVVGTWGNTTSKQAMGFYSFPINPFNEQTKISYTSFGLLNHYLDAQKPKRAKRIKEKAEEAARLNRFPDFTNYVMPYKIEEIHDTFILLAEVYTPSSSVNRYPNNYPYGYYPNPYYSPFWGPYPGSYNRMMYNPSYAYGNNMRSTDEIKTSQSVIVAFGKDGKVKWDYSLKLEETRSAAVEQVADFCFHDGKVHFLYKKESDIIIKTIILENGETSEATQKVKLLNDSDELRSESKTIGAVRQWYGNNFYVWGQRTIRDRAKKGDGTRQVFYINKVVVN